MRVVASLLALGWMVRLVAGASATDRASAPSPAGDVRLAPSARAEPVPTFRHDIAPLLKANCTPCHFKGGKVVDRYPFEQYEIVRKLGLRLNTRLKGADADLIARWVKAKSPQ
jgi:hypothetical protein